MRRNRMTAIAMRAAVIVAVAAIGLALAELIWAPLFGRTIRHGYTREELRKRNVWVIQYALTVDQVYGEDKALPYCPGDPGAALDSALSEIGDFEMPLAYLPTGFVLREPSDIKSAYLYLNPKPGTPLAPDTIIVIEADFYFGDRSLCAGTVSGDQVILPRVSRSPAQLLGTEIKRLDAE